MLQCHTQSLLPFPDKPQATLGWVSPRTKLNPLTAPSCAPRKQVLGNNCGAPVGCPVQRLVSARALQMQSTNRLNTPRSPSGPPWHPGSFLSVSRWEPNPCHLLNASQVPAPSAPARGPAATRCPEAPPQPSRSSAGLQRTPVFPALHPTYRGATPCPTTGHREYRLRPGAEARSRRLFTSFRRGPSSGTRHFGLSPRTPSLGTVPDLFSSPDQEPLTTVNFSFSSFLGVFPR